MLFAQCAQFFPPHPVIASFSSTDESEKRVRTSAVKLLVCRRLTGGETHHRQNSDPAAMVALALEPASVEVEESVADTEPVRTK